MNSVNLMGRLTADPELRATASGKSVVRFCIAVYRSKEVTDFINCVAYEGSADLLVRYVHKGDMVGVSGTLSVNTVENNGERRTYTNVIVNRLSLCGAVHSPSETPSVAPAPASEFIPVDADDDIPF